jgi:hypothetical protein
MARIVTAMAKRFCPRDLQSQQANMYCKSCHYSLENLVDLRCPECNREFDPEDPSTFDVEPKRRRWIMDDPLDFAGWLLTILLALFLLFGFCIVSR